MQTRIGPFDTDPYHQGMDVKDALNKIMEKHGWNQHELAKALEVTQPSVSRWLSGADPRGETREKIRELLREDYSTVTSTAGEKTTTRGISVKGQAAAGLWFDEGAVDESVYGEIPIAIARYATIEQSAYRVMGDSMDKLGFLDGSFVITVDYWKVRAAIQDGDTVVVEQRDGGRIERTVKVVAITPDSYRLEARSNNPKWAGSAIVIPRVNADMADDRSTEIVGLVIGNYRPVG